MEADPNPPQPHISMWLALDDMSESETDAELAQKLGQLQPFTAVFPQECMGQLVSFGPASHLPRSAGHGLLRDR